MAELNVTTPNLPLAPNEYDPRYQDQLNNILRLFFNQINNPGNMGGATLNLNINSLPNQTNLANLRSGDVFYDTSGGAAPSYPLRIKA
jgi:hypothetical protein